MKTLLQLLMKKKRFTTIINEEKNYRELKESIRIIKTQANDTEKNCLVEEGKRKGIDEIIRQNAKQCYLIV